MKIQEGRLSSLESTFKSQRQQNKDKNTELLTGCIYVTKLLGTQGMAFRGHRESFDLDNSLHHHLNELSIQPNLHPPHSPPLPHQPPPVPNPPGHQDSAGPHHKGSSA